MIAEGMIVVKFKKAAILNAVICLLAAYYTFNVHYPWDTAGHNKNIFLFLEHVLISEKKGWCACECETLSF